MKVVLGVIAPFAALGLLAIAGPIAFILIAGLWILTLD